MERVEKSDNSKDEHDTGSVTWEAKSKFNNKTPSSEDVSRVFCRDWRWPVSHTLASTAWRKMFNVSKTCKNMSRQFSTAVSCNHCNLLHHCILFLMLFDAVSFVDLAAIFCWCLWFCCATACWLATRLLEFICTDFVTKHQQPQVPSCLVCASPVEELWSWVAETTVLTRLRLNRWKMFQRSLILWI